MPETFPTVTATTEPAPDFDIPGPPPAPETYIVQSAFWYDAGNCWLRTHLDYPTLARAIKAARTCAAEGRRNIRIVTIPGEVTADPKEPPHA